MATATIGTAQRAIEKARRTKPAVVQMDATTWAVASSTPGQGYTVRLAAGAMTCECQGYERIGCCYHIGAVVLSVRPNPDPVRLARSAQAVRAIGYAYAMTGEVA